MDATVLLIHQPLYIPVAGRIHMLRADMLFCLVLALMGVCLVLRMALKAGRRGRRSATMLPLLCMLVVLDIAKVFDFRKQLHEALPQQQVNGLASGSVVRLTLRNSEWPDRVEAAETQGECGFRPGSDFVLPVRVPIVLHLVGRATQPPFSLMMTLSASGPTSCVKAILVDALQLGRLMMASEIAEDRNGGGMRGLVASVLTLVR